jgi:hypothetical protein
MAARRADAGRRVVWQRGWGEARGRRVLKRGSETRVMSNCRAPQRSARFHSWPPRRCWPGCRLQPGRSRRTIPARSRSAKRTSGRRLQPAGSRGGCLSHRGDHRTADAVQAHRRDGRIEDLGFVPRGEAGAFIAQRNTAPERQIAAQHQSRGPCPTCIPACTACTHCRRACARCAAPPAPKIPGAKISVCHGVGGMFAASGTIIMSNEGGLSRHV